MEAPPDQPSSRAALNKPPTVPISVRIEQRSGDTIEIGTNTLDNTGNQSFPHSTKNAQGKPTRSIVFQREQSERIVSISDPEGQNANGDPVGFPAVNTNTTAWESLVKVLKLLDRATARI